jgi:hypothetical protein
VAATVTKITAATIRSDVEPAAPPPSPYFSEAKFGDIEPERLGARPARLARQLLTESVSLVQF